MAHNFVPKTSIACLLAAWHSLFLSTSSGLKYSPAQQLEQLKCIPDKHTP